MVEIAVTERPRNRIRIVDIPPGEAPADIREEWVELIIPTSRSFAELAEEFFPGSGDEMSDDSEIIRGTPTYGVESGLPTDNDNSGGFVVDALDAIAALEAKGTSNGKRAADYWRRTLGSFGPLDDEQLVFARRVCELLSSNQNPEE